MDGRPITPEYLGKDGLMAEYIEKQAAKMIPVLPKEHREYQTMNLDDAYENGWYDALECIAKLPAADVRPVVHGRWEKDNDGLDICSECESIALQRVFIKLPEKIVDLRMVRSRFCPNCGAKNKEDA